MRQVRKLYTFRIKGNKKWELPLRALLLKMREDEQKLEDEYKPLLPEGRFYKRHFTGFVDSKGNDYRIFNYWFDCYFTLDYLRKYWKILKALSLEPALQSPGIFASYEGYPIRISRGYPGTSYDCILTGRKREHGHFETGFWA